MKCRKLNLPKPALLIYYFVKSLGLAPFKLKNDVFHTTDLMDKLYSVIVAAVHFIFSVTRIREFLKTVEINNFNETVILHVRILIISLHCISTMVIHIAILLMNERAVHVMNELCTLSKKLSNFGIREDNERLFKTALTTIVTANTINLIIMIAVHCFESELTVVSSIYLVVRHLVSLNMILIFAQILLYIGQRFTLVNEILNDIFTRNNRDRSARFVVSGDIRQENIGYNDGLQSNLQCIWRIEALHFKLYNLLRSTTHLFSVPIIFISFRTLCEIVTFSYRIYSAFVSNPSLSSFIFLPLTFLSIFGLLYITHASETTCRKGNATNLVLLEVWKEVKSVELENEFAMFFLQLLRCRIAVSTFGFLTVDYSLVYKIFCATVTYLVIMIQLETSQSDEIEDLLGNHTNNTIIPWVEQ